MRCKKVDINEYGDGERLFDSVHSDSEFSVEPCVFDDTLNLRISGKTYREVQLMSINERCITFRQHGDDKFTDIHIYI